MSNELKPCPFCGGGAKHYSRHNAAAGFCQNDTDHWVSCRGEDCFVTVGMTETREDAVARWNTRAPQPAASVDRGALVRVLKEGWIRAMSDPGPDGQSNKINCQADALIAAGWHNQPEAVVRDEVIARVLQVMTDSLCEDPVAAIRALRTTPSETAGDKVEALDRVMLEAAYRQHANDFKSMTDEEIDEETRDMERQRDEAETWLEAVAARKALASIGGQNNG